MSIARFSSKTLFTSKTFENGDKYDGEWLGGVPHGAGTYVWSDGSQYDGEWLNGCKHGAGKYVWPSGAAYEGDWVEGAMHGMGTYQGTDGENYTGGWVHDVKSGFGNKVYANGDSFKGLWKNGMADGPGIYKWVDGNEYNGDWMAGNMHGRGVFVWKRGERYDGEWAHGREHGAGVFTWPDGSMYEGTWENGLKEGEGWWVEGAVHTFLNSSDKHRAAEGGGARRPSMEKSMTMNGSSPSTSAGALAAMTSAGERGGEGQPQFRRSLTVSSAGAGAGVTSDPEDYHEKAGGGVGFSGDEVVTSGASGDSGGGSEGDATGPQTIFRRVRSGGRRRSTSTAGRQMRKSPTFKKGDGEERLAAVKLRTYRSGVLVEEKDALLEDAQAMRTKVAQKNRHKHSLKSRLKSKRQVSTSNRLGETVFKGHRSYDLMVQLQLGVWHSVGKVTAEPEVLKLGEEDYMRSSKQNFPRAGSESTPPHWSDDFKWKDYCPMVFRQLRERFGIDAGDYMLSLCGGNALRELSSPGKSGSVFFVSHDARFIIKTMRKHEMKLLLRLLPQYFAHVREHEHTLHTKFFGLHRIKPSSGRNVRFVVMGNLFATDHRLQRKYDLKGSTYGRVTVLSKGKRVTEATILKDLDLDAVFKLEPSWREKLVRQLAADVKLLEQLHVMDYSLLLGVHFVKDDTEDEDDEDGVADRSDRLKCIRQSLNTDEMPLVQSGDEDGWMDEDNALPSPSGAGAISTVGPLGPPSPSASSMRWDSSGKDAAYTSLKDARVDRGGLRKVTFSKGQEFGGQEFGGAEWDRGGPWCSLDKGLVPPKQSGDEKARRMTDDLAAYSTPDGGMFEAPLTARSQATEAPNRSVLLNSRPQHLRTPILDAEAQLRKKRPYFTNLGVRMPAVVVANEYKPGEPAPSGSVRTWTDAEGGTCDVVLYFGIIDILQEFNLSKELENVFKPLIHRKATGNNVSAVSPLKYSKRFQEFMQKTFQ